MDLGQPRSVALGCIVYSPIKAQFYLNLSEILGSLQRN